MRTFKFAFGFFEDLYLLIFYEKDGKDGESKYEM